MRTYDAAHLQAHPLQTIRGLHVAHTAAAIAHERAEDAQQEREKQTPEGAFWHRRLVVAVGFRGERKSHAEIPVCNRVSQDGRIYCHNDACDGADYGIYLKADGKDGLLVWPAGLRLDGGCGSGDDAPIPEFSPGKDDKLLRLQRAPLAQCAPPP